MSPKILTSLAAAMVLTSAAADPMRNLNLGTCIQEIIYDTDLLASFLQMGDCNNERVPDLTYDGSAIRTVAGNCLSNSDGEILLERCRPQNTQQEWIMMVSGQLRNPESNQCLSVDLDGKALIMETCATPSLDNPQGWTVFNKTAATESNRSTSAPTTTIVAPLPLLETPPAETSSPAAATTITPASSAASGAVPSVIVSTSFLLIGAMSLFF